MAEPFLGEIRLMANISVPRGWLPCDGRLLGVTQNQALFSLLGTKFGGDGQKTFGLPDLRGRVIMGGGSGPNTQVGQAGGQETVTLSPSNIPTHVHTINASTAVGTTASVAGALFGQVAAVVNATPAKLAYGPNPDTPIAADTMTQTGGSLPHDNMQPTLVMNYIIATTGIYPSRGS
jgi:microcystin-dependent protein